MRYAVVCPILDVNTGQYRNAVRALATGVYTELQTGYDENGVVVPNLLANNSENIVKRFVLTGVVPEIEVDVWVGWHPLVAENIRDRYTDVQWVNLHQTAFNPPPAVTEEWMLTRMKQFAQEHGCAKVWLLRPGDSLVTASPADRLSRFLPF